MAGRELGWPVIRLESVDSTNRYLKERGGALPHGTVCLTANQRAGRGRLGRSWTVPEGETLALSVLLREEGDVGTLPLLCGMAVSAALRELTGDGGFLIKWPNDIVCRERKVCGILCESRPAEGGPVVAAGIGVNLLQTAEELEAAGLPYAASVRQLTGLTLTVRVTAGAIVRRLDRLWERCRAGGFACLREEYAARCINIGRPVRALNPDGTVRLEGTAVDIAPDGALLVETPGGLQAVRAGEASVRGLYGYI